IRANSILFGGCTPYWATRGVCDIHAEMLAAERAMRAVLSGRSIADLAKQVAAKMPKNFVKKSEELLAGRVKGPTSAIHHGGGSRP
ncbi:MAG: hypothetical protein ACO25F_12615, partial [Erythrobacter sp.]